MPPQRNRTLKGTDGQGVENWTMRSQYFSAGRRSRLLIVLLTLIGGGSAPLACSDPFTSCDATRNCAPRDEPGAMEGEAGANTGGAQNVGGPAGMSNGGESDAPSISGAGRPEEGGVGGMTEAPAGTSDNPSISEGGSAGEQATPAVMPHAR